MFVFVVRGRALGNASEVRVLKYRLGDRHELRISGSVSPSSVCRWLRFLLVLFDEHVALPHPPVFLAVTLQFEFSQRAGRYGFCVEPARVGMRWDACNEKGVVALKRSVGEAVVPVDTVVGSVRGPSHRERQAAAA